MTLRLAAALVALSALTACAPGGVRVTHPELRSQYSRTEMLYAFHGRDAEVVVNGSPFPGATSAGAATTAVMNRVPVGPRTNFTTAPGESVRRPYRVVLAYAPAVAVTGEGLCARPDLPTRPRTGEGTALQGALCHGPNLLSGAYATAGPVDGPDDPRFQELVARLTFALFPIENPQHSCAPTIIRNC